MKFSLLATLLIFPHSTGVAERLFSQFKLIQTEKRDNLKPGTIEGLVLLKQNELKRENEDKFDQMLLINQ